MTLGIAIPAHVNHLFGLKKLLMTISQSTVLPKQVSVSVSSFDGNLDLGNYPFELIITTTNERKNACENRNTAAKKLKTDIISFIDADDLVHVKMVEYLVEAFKKGAKAVVHDYYQNADRESDWYISEIGPLDYHHEYVDTALENWSFAINSKQHRDYACGHISVKKNIFDKIFYDESIGWEVGEDAEYTVRLVKNKIKISYISNRITQYVK